MFWDNSAIIPLLLPEPRSVVQTEALTADREVTLWWDAPVECLSAVCRRHRETAVPSLLVPPTLS
jgi:uncharacterized protein with PIN domain